MRLHYHFPGPLDGCFVVLIHWYRNEINEIHWTSLKQGYVGLNIEHPRCKLTLKASEHIPRTNEWTSKSSVFIFFIFFFIFFAHCNYITNWSIRLVLGRNCYKCAALYSFLEVTVQTVSFGMWVFTAPSNRTPSLSCQPLHPWKEGLASLV